MTARQDTDWQACERTDLEELKHVPSLCLNIKSLKYNSGKLTAVQCLKITASWPICLIYVTQKSLELNSAEAADTQF